MNSSPNAHKSAKIETRTPRMLKEFLKNDDSSSTSRSNSSVSEKQSPASLQRSRSRSRAAVSSFQKLIISAFKSLRRIPPSTSCSPPSMLSRSLSKRFLTKFQRSKSSRSCSGEERKNSIKVKDILRWRSFRDEDKSMPSDSTETASTTTTSAVTTASESINIEESDFSFTAEEWRDGEKWKDFENGVVEVEDVDGGDLLWETTATMDAPLVIPEEDDIEEECEEDKEQHSPVSILNSPFRDEISDEEAASSSFDQSLANVERTKQRLLESIQWLETLAGVDEESSSDEEDSEEEEEVKEENGKSRDYMLKVLGRLTMGEQGEKGRECIRDMERQVQWGKFGEERQEVGEDLESCLLHDLVHDLFLDLFGTPI